MTQLSARPKFETIVLANSPVDFVLVGPSPEGRRVFIRSSGINTDLIALDLRENYNGSRNEEFKIGDIHPFDVFLGYSPGRNAVHTSEIFLPDNLLSAGRRSHYTLAWRGSTSKGAIKIIQRQLVYKSADLTEAINRNSAEEAEWHIAPLLLLCSEAMESRIKFYKTFRGALLATVVLYVLIGVLYYIDKFVINIK